MSFLCCLCRFVEEGWWSGHSFRATMPLGYLTKCQKKKEGETLIKWLDNNTHMLSWALYPVLPKSCFHNQ